MSTASQALPLYAVIDRRQDGRKRILAEFRDPIPARVYADTLRAVGDAAEVLLLSEFEGETQ